MAFRNLNFLSKFAKTFALELSENVTKHTMHICFSKKPLGKTSMEKTFSFGHCPNKGGGGLLMPEFFGPFSRSAFLVKKKSLFLQKCQCIELLIVF